MENRRALVVDTLEIVADRPGNHRITLGADKTYDVAEFLADLRAHDVAPHMAQNTTNRRSAIDGRTTRHPGYAVSGRVRKRIEQVFGWTKTAAGFRKTHHRGLARVGWIFIPHAPIKPQQHGRQSNQLFRRSSGSARFGSICYTWPLAGCGRNSALTSSLLSFQKLLLLELPKIANQGGFSPISRVLPCPGRFRFRAWLRCDRH
jgi:hypothetical protein